MRIRVFGVYENFIYFGRHSIICSLQAGVRQSNLTKKKSITIYKTFREYDGGYRLMTVAVSTTVAY